MRFRHDVELGQAMQSAREHRGVSQVALAHMIGLTSACLARFEAGEIRVPAIVLHRIARSLGVALSSLFAPASPGRPCARRAIPRVPVH